MAFATAAAAAGGTLVTILNGDGTSLQVSLGSGGLSVGPTGAITLSVNETLQNTSGSGGCTTTPTISVSGIPSSATSGQALTGTITVSSGATVIANNGTVSGSAWSWSAPAVSATTTYNIVFTATAAGCSTTASYSVNVSPSGGGGGSATLLPSTGVGMVIGQGVAVAPLGQNNYSFTLPSAAASYVAVMMTTRDWQTNQDVYVSTSSQPSCSTACGYNVPPQPAPWYNNTTTSNESAFIFTPFAAQTTFYVTVCNRSSIEGKYGLYWSQK